MTISPQSAKLAYTAALSSLAALPAQLWPTALRNIYHPDVLWHGPHPINAQPGARAVIANFWQPFLHALPDLERRDDILMCGAFNNGAWVGATGYYTGTFTNDWLGIKATGGVLNVRYGEFSRLEGGKVCEVYLILDILDVLRQAGQWPRGLPTSPGLADRNPGPFAHDGVLRADTDAREGIASLALVESMIAGLMSYDRLTLESMHMERFWHPQMMSTGQPALAAVGRLKVFRTCISAPS